jgi:RNA-binding protein NOB1
MSELLSHLVVDSGAIISGLGGFGFHRVAHSFCTVPEVLAEIRDEKSRDHLAALPFALETRNPSEEAMKAVSEFAQKSGDYSSLSLTDLKLIALTYMLEAQAAGSAEHIRKEPFVRDYAAFATFIYTYAE